MKFMPYLLSACFIVTSCTSTPQVTMTPVPTDEAEVTWVPSAPPSMIQTSESGGSGSIADNPPEYVAGFDGDIADLESEDMQLIKDFQWLSIYKKYKNLEGQEVKFLNEDDFHKNMEQFAREHPEIEQLTKQDARTGRVLVWFQVKSGDGYDVYYDVTANGAIASTDPMWTGSLKVTREKVHFQGKPDFRMGDDGHWYGFTIDGNGTATHWFSTNGATVDNAEEKMVEVEREMEKVYESCLDPDLQESVRSNMEAKLGMTAKEYFLKLHEDPKHAVHGQYAFKFGYNGDGEIYGQVVIAGFVEVSLDGLSGFSADDIASCVMVSSEQDPDVMIPVVYSFTKNGEYNSTLIHTSGAKVDGKYPNASVYSLESQRQYFGVMGEKVIGEVVNLTIRRFGKEATDETFSTYDRAKFFYGKNIAKLTSAMGADYLSRVEAAGGSPLEMYEKLDPNMRDLGLFANRIREKVE